MTNIAIEDLTTIKVNGSGAFDNLMQATKNHLQEEYKAGRIKGAEYSQVYLGSLVAVMDQAVKFLTAAQQNELITAQTEKVRAEIELVGAQISLTEAQIALAAKQLEKADAENALLNQKVKTEIAQILDQVDGQNVMGVIGKQKNLYQAQTDGFSRDAEHKMAKLMADVYAIQRTTDEALLPPTELSASSINSVINKAKTGIGA